MYSMRQQTMEWKDKVRIEDFLSKAKVGHLGLSDDDFPYVIPLNFTWLNGFIYFHGASEGRKIDIMAKNQQACFTVYEELGTMSDPVPAKTDTAYMSVMVFGRTERVADLNEATEVMQSMLDKYVPGYYANKLASTHVEKYRSSLGSKTAVFKVIPEIVTAKENELNENRRFFPGRTALSDMET
ncbi:pyridoxamine 5'-phosphate oxidase family protein [Bacillus sp. ISL-47]|uniref:pyridoxamine 5'-phosphate oxidase family protein n=1 Tax=Bacillus sp. ISL-47 TaxID=2819130 RepID=UPI001BEC7FA0|nr:pyridoxamine 5'-phosphate oxidase family protein [Bacillus sp. ISL-47]MBT2688171.1 pyridoxamine 5'-phosphate oxidase family protein [Bacillus sp. ISL-47]MBT2708457.1 pyridoxamine 5'-phosphate oxidase family protein [Pseudomonas sp. ISL-84]